MNDPRVDAVARIIRNGDVMPGNLRPPLDLYIGDAQQALINADAADREQGIHRVRVNQAFEQRLFHVIEAVIVDRNKVLNVGLSDEVTDAVLAALTGAES